MLDEYLDAMETDSARTMLDMGCGTGVAARTIARRASFAGEVRGIGLSPCLVREARRLADASRGASGGGVFFGASNYYACVARRPAKTG